MRLSDAARFFDRTPVIDATTGLQTCLGQVLAFDDAKRDNAAAFRRILSTSDAAVVPEVATILGLNWLVGSPNPDGWSEINRTKRVLQKVSDACSVQTLQDFLAGVVTYSTYGSVVYAADGKERGHSSDVLQTYEVALPPSLPLEDYNLVTLGQDRFLITTSYVSPAGYRAGAARKLDAGASVTASVVLRAYDPVAGRHTSQTTTSTPALRLLWQDLYEYFGQADERHQEGDYTLVVSPHLGIDTGSEVSVDAQAYSVLAVQPVGGVLALHVRPK